MATIKLEKIIIGDTTTYKKNGTSITAVAVDLLGLTNYRLKSIATTKKNVTEISGRVTETKSINYSVNGTGTVGTATYSSGTPSQSYWNAGTITKILEIYENNYLSKAKIPVGILNLTTEIIKSETDYYHGNNSQIAGLVSTVPKIYQGTEASFVVIESPFEPAPQQTQYANGCGNWSGCGRHGSSVSRAPGDKYSFFQRGPSTGCYTWYYVSSTCTTGSTIGKSGDANYTSTCGNQLSFSGNIPERACTDSLVRCSFGGEWIADPHTTQADGFLFWSRYSGTSKADPGSGGIIQIQKSMLFRENQTKIDTTNMWTRGTPSSNGFKARMINWESNHNPLLKERWLLSPDGKLATYYTVQSPTWGDFADLEASTPTTLTV